MSASRNDRSVGALQASRSSSVFLVVSIGIGPLLATSCTSRLPPPVTRRDTVVDTIRGVAIPDPYRWLEDQTSPETRAWLEAQNAYAEQVIGRAGARAYLEHRLGRLMEADDNLIRPRRAGGHEYFVMRRVGGEGAILYRRPVPKEGDESPIDPRGEYETVIDPGAWTPDYTTSIGIAALSSDGKLLAYTVRDGGPDEIEVRIRDLDRGVDLPDRLPPALYGNVWFGRDRKRLFYVHQSRTIGPRAKAHVLGTDVAEDSVVFGHTGPDSFLYAAEIAGGRYLLYTIDHGWTRSEIHVQDLQRGGPPRVIVNDVEARFDAKFLDGQLYLVTNFLADRNRVLEVPIDDPARDRWREVIPEGEHLLEDFTLIDGKFYVTFLEDVSNRIRVFAKDGTPAGALAVPDFHSASIRPGKPGTAILTLASLTSPTTEYRVELSTGARTVQSRSAVEWDTTGIEVEQRWFASKDGTRSPMYVMRRRDVALDGRPFALLTGYGGFNVSRKPRFNPMAAAWVELGGVYAVATLRGGAEFGESWHRDGMLENKQNVFDDFIGAAEWLIDNRYTSPDRLAIQGGSNAGLLVGAALTQRPDLFSAVLCSVPDVEILRFPHFPEVTNIPALREYGDARILSEFEAIRRYSPYQNVRDRTAYPAVMFLTGDLDTRVPPLGARKMTARLQAATTSDRPVILWYNPRMGHAGGRPASRLVADAAMQLAFALDQLGVEVDSTGAVR
ncbi:MAG: prolyl oligopeptidase family protein [Gemmatimonadales bacterium]